MWVSAKKETSDNLWHDSWSAKTDLVAILCCKANVQNVCQQCSVARKKKAILIWEIIQHEGRYFSVLGFGSFI